MFSGIPFAHTRNRFVRPLFHPDGDPPAEPPADDPPSPEPKPYEQVEGERNRLREETAKLKKERDELAAFKAEQEAAAEEKRQADLAAKGEFETLRAEIEAERDRLKAENAAYQEAEQKRRDAQAEANEEFLKGRTDADALRGKAVRLVGDDPFKQAELYRELAAATDTGSPPTGAPSRSGGHDQHGEAELTADDLLYLRSVGEDTPEGRKLHAERKAAAEAAGTFASIDQQVALAGATRRVK